MKLLLSMITALLPMISNYSNQHNQEHHTQERQILMDFKWKVIHIQQQASFKHSKKLLLIK